MFVKTSLPMTMLAVALVSAASPGCRSTDGGYQSSGCHSSSSGSGCHAGGSEAGPPRAAVSGVARSDGCNSCPGETASPREDDGYSPLVLREPASGFEPRPESDPGPTGRQRTCPVTGAELGSMGAPVAVGVREETIYVCCAGCVGKLKRNPDKYLGRSEISLKGLQ